MFNPLLRELCRVYKGNVIYLPESVYEMVKTWMISLDPINKYRPDDISYNGKLILPFDEDAMLTAYQSTPIHVPERIMEKSIVIETTLEPKPVEQPREEVKPEPTKPNSVRYGRRPGTKKKSFRDLF